MVGQQHHSRLLGSSVVFTLRLVQRAFPVRAGCVPALREGTDPFATSLGDFDPGEGEPLLNRDAFEPVESFNCYTGAGPRVSNVRLYPYTNTNLSLYKTTRIAEKVRLELRLEFFNLWNQHIFTDSGQFGSSAFVNDIAAPDFGFWNGAVTNPRNIQMERGWSFRGNESGRPSAPKEPETDRRQPSLCGRWSPE